MKNFLFALAALVTFASGAQSIVEVTYLDMPATKIGRFVELHKEMLETMNGDQRTVRATGFTDTGMAQELRLLYTKYMTQQKTV